MPKCHTGCKMQHNSRQGIGHKRVKNNWNWPRGSHHPQITASAPILLATIPGHLDDILLPATAAHFRPIISQPHLPICQNPPPINYPKPPLWNPNPQPYTSHIMCLLSHDVHVPASDLQTFHDSGANLTTPPWCHFVSLYHSSRSESTLATILVPQCPLGPLFTPATLPPPPITPPHISPSSTITLWPSFAGMPCTWSSTSMNLHYHLTSVLPLPICMITFPSEQPQVLIHSFNDGIANNSHMEFFYSPPQPANGPPYYAPSPPFYRLMLTNKTCQSKKPFFFVIISLCVVSLTNVYFYYLIFTNQT